MTTEAVALLPTSQPCPSWCQEPDGHPYEDDGLNEPQRWHTAWLGEVELTQLDRVDIVEDGVQVVTDGVRICIGDDGSGGGAVDLTQDRLASLLPDLQRALSLLR